MPVTVNHNLTATTPDDPAYEIRPSHWNDAHVAVMSATAGNEIFGAFSNDAAYNVSFSTNAGGQVVASANVTAAPSPVNITGANGSSVNAQTLAFSNSNGMTLGVSTAANGATVTGSYTVPTQTAYVFSNSNGVTFGTNGSTVTASVQTNYLTSQSNQAVSAANGSSTFQTLSFANSNGISFGTAAGGLTASHNGLTTARASNDAVGLNTAQSNVTWTVNSSGLSLDARGYAGTGTSATNASVTLNSNGIAISVAAPGGGGNFSAGVSNGGNTAGDTGITGTRLVFAGGNNVTLSQATDANGATITFSGANAGGAQTGISGIQVSNTTYTSGTVTWQNANGISFGSSGANGISASYTVPSTAGLISAVGVTGQNGNFTTTGLSFSNGNGVSFGTSAGSAITASHNGLTSQSNQAASAANGSFAFQTLSFSNLNGISFGTSAGSAITASHNGLTTARASNDAIGLNTAQSNVTWTVNSSGLSLDARGYAGTGTSATNASITLNSNGLAISVAAGGGATPVASASNGSFSFTTLAFSNANNVTFGTSAGSIITASVAAPGAAAENNWVNLLGANTAGNTTASGSTIGYSGINLTLSGTNGSIVNISAPATSSLSATGAVSISTNGSTISIGAPAERTLNGYLEAFIDRELLAAQIGNNQLFVQPMNLRHPAQWEEVAWINNYSNATNSSNSATLTLQVGVYSRTGNTLSLITSNSGSYAVTNSGTVGSYSLYGGLREYPIPMTTTLPAGNYWVGFLSRTTTGGGAGMTWSNFVASNINSAYSGRWSSANNATNQYAMGLGSFNTTTTAMRDSIALSQINGSAAVNMRPVIYKLVSADLN